MRQYEVTFIVDPVLSDDEIKQTAKMYLDFLMEKGAELVHEEAWGLRQLAYPINRRTSGVYYTYEVKLASGEAIVELETGFRRDDRIIRFLTVKLDKHGVKYNEDKRNGLIGRKKEAEEEVEDVVEEEKTKSKA